MIVFLLLIIGLPIAMTLVFGDKDRTIAYWMPMTLMIVFVLWTIISLPCVLMQTKFHVPLYIFICVMVLVVVFIIFMLIKKRKYVVKKVKNFFSRDNKKMFANAFFIIMAVLIMYQAGRATFFTPSDYGDNKTYVALANDILETDSFYLVDSDSGELTDAKSISTKYRLSTWYSFESVLSVVCGTAPLAIVYTYLPGIVIILSYLIWWIIFKKFFDENLQAVSMALLVTVILYEFMDSDISNIFLNWPTYGKNITSMIVVPLIIFEWMMLGNKKSNYKMNLLYLALLSCAGCGASNMGFLIIPLEFVILAISRFIVNKRVDFKTIATLFFANLPVAVFSAVYIFAG